MPLNVAEFEVVGLNLDCVFPSLIFLFFEIVNGFVFDYELEI